MNSLWGAAGHPPLPSLAVGDDRIDAAETDNLVVEASRIHLFDHDARAIYRDPESQVLCALVGYVANLPALRASHGIAGRHDVEVVGALYRRGNLKAVREIEGAFVVLLYDQASHMLFLGQDEHGAGLPVYYAPARFGLVFSTGLRLLLKHADFPRELDRDAARALLSSGVVVPREETLVRGVKKLLPRQCLIFDVERHELRTERQDRSWTPTPLRRAAQRLLPAVQASVVRLCEQLPPGPRTLTLSAGYDSNFLLHTLRDLPHDGLTAITIGGRKVNEIANARQIVADYCRAGTRLKHITRTIGPEALGRLPDIVWRLEGYVCELGVFLQYELAQTLRAEGTAAAFLGEGADQVLRRWRPRALKVFQGAWKMGGRVLGTVTGRQDDTLRGIVQDLRSIAFIRRLSKRFRRYRHAPAGYDESLDYILKKNGLMLNSFGVQGLYPYLCRELGSLAESLWLLNVDKLCYKLQVRRRLGPRLSRLICKTGGNTDVAYLFAGRETEIFSTVLGAEPARSLLDAAEIEWLQRNCRHCLPQRMGANLLLALLSLHLFQELFLSGKYDDRLTEEGCELDLWDSLGLSSTGRNLHADSGQAVPVH